jgi:hypothetical protein
LVQEGVWRGGGRGPIGDRAWHFVVVRRKRRGLEVFRREPARPPGLQGSRLQLCRILGLVGFCPLGLTCCLAIAIQRTLLFLRFQS